jgi:hypothetical protein
MGDLRKERIAVNEGLFRNANERMAEWEETGRDGEPELYVCECADSECRKRIRLSREEYERVRGDSRHFAVAPGHQIPDAETVIEENDGWLLVEKDEDVAETVRSMDQRSD